MMNDTASINLLDLKQVIKKISFKKSYIYKEIKEGRFPAPQKFGNSSRWPENKIDVWIENNSNLCS